MNIVMEKELHGRLQDGINTILNLNEKDFNKLISMLTVENGKKLENFIYLFYSTDEYKNSNSDIKLGVNENNERGYVGGLSYGIKDFISELETYMHNLDKTSNEYIRCQEIVNTRSLEAFKRIFEGKNGEKKECKGFTRYLSILLRSNRQQHDHGNHGLHFPELRGFPSGGNPDHPGNPVAGFGGLRFVRGKAEHQNPGKNAGHLPPARNPCLRVDLSAAGWHRLHLRPDRRCGPAGI